MPVDKFGHFTVSTNESLKRHASKTFGFNLDRDRNLNLQNKRIKNVSDPIEDKDVVTKTYLNSELRKTMDDIALGVLQSLAKIEDKISNLSKDVITKAFFQKEIKDMQNQIGYGMKNYLEEIDEKFSDINRQLREITAKPPGK